MEEVVVCWEVSGVGEEVGEEMTEGVPTRLKLASMLEMTLDTEESKDETEDADAADAADAVEAEAKAAD